MINNSEVTNPIFPEAVDAIDAGDLAGLKSLVEKYPYLVSERLATSREGYFSNPYLLWFVADNPIRTGKLPPNIIAITSLLIAAVKKQSPGTAGEQLNYALRLVVTGLIPHQCGVQIPLIDLLIDEGAKPGGGVSALANGNTDAARHLIIRGEKLTLPVAVGLEQIEDVKHLLLLANEDEKLTALTVAAFYGNTNMLSLLLGLGVNTNGYPKKESGFHAHATPLHQAVSSGSLGAVKLLVKAGASLNAKDKVYDGTPYGWAMHMQAEGDEVTKKKFNLIAAYLQSLKASS